MVQLQISLSEIDSERIQKQRLKKRWLTSVAAVGIMMGSQLKIEVAILTAVGN